MILNYPFIGSFETSESDDLSDIKGKLFFFYVRNLKGISKPGRAKTVIVKFINSLCIGIWIVNIFFIFVKLYCK